MASASVAPSLAAPPSLPEAGPPAAPEEAPPDPTLGTIDAPSPPAPCDLSRFYRGDVEGAKVSVVLRRSGSALRGASAYDSGFGELAIAGKVDAASKFVLRERKDGKDVAVFEGTCEPGTGALAGKWKQGSVEKAFALRPREVTGVGIVERRRTLGKGGDVTPACVLDIVSPAVFGLGDAQRAARINGVLRMGFGRFEAEMAARVRTCPPGGDAQVLGWYSIEANQNGVLDDGLAVLVQGTPTIAAGLEFSGPVIRWGALLREGVLKRTSPVARLWAKERPLGNGEPACERIFSESASIMAHMQ